MGGQSSTQYEQFLSLACEAFNTVRKHCHLLINLFLMMLSTGIPELRVRILLYILVYYNILLYIRNKTTCCTYVICYVWIIMIQKLQHFSENKLLFH